MPPHTSVNGEQSTSFWENCCSSTKIFHPLQQLGNYPPRNLFRPVHLRSEIKAFVPDTTAHSDFASTSSIINFLTISSSEGKLLSAVCGKFTAIFACVLEHVCKNFTGTFFVCKSVFWSQFVKRRSHIFQHRKDIPGNMASHQNSTTHQVSVMCINVFPLPMPLHIVTISVYLPYMYSMYIFALYVYHVYVSSGMSHALSQTSLPL